MILEEKTTLGLADVPPDIEEAAGLTETEMEARALSERQDRARQEKMTVQTRNKKSPWTDYIVTSKASGKTYRVALRGQERGVSYCSCPDYRSNTLGTCKHVMHVLRKVKRRFPATAMRRSYRRKDSSVRLDYGEEISLRLELPSKIPARHRESSQTVSWQAN